MSDRRRTEIDFNDPRRTPFAEGRSRGELPHLYKEGGSYFVTFRLWDAVDTPTTGSKRQGNIVVQPSRLRGGRAPGAGETPAPQSQKAAATSVVVQPSRLHDPESADEIALATEPPLKLGSCILHRPDAAALVQDALLHFDGHRYQLAAWCVMPNHVHAAYTALGEHSPEDIHHTWKSYTSHEINKLLGRRGIVWERESFDHLVRSVEHYEAYVAYIEENPVQAGLCGKADEWLFSSAGYRRR